MIKVGKWIAKHRILILIAAILLLIPSAIGYLNTRTNYDLLTYLPSNLETVQGQEIMVDDFGTGAFSMIVVKDKTLKEVQDLAEQMKQIEHVTKVLWYGSVLDISIPVEMLPDTFRSALVNADENEMLLIVMLDTSTSADESMEAIRKLQNLLDENLYVSGMTAIVSDLSRLADKEVPIYVIIAVSLSFIVLQLTGRSFITPFLFLLSIGFAVIYNMGTNLFLGDISYITKALAAVLQLGVTMDYSIFLLDSFEEYKRKYPEDKNRAMGHAIATTFQSILGSSITTIAGFIALCFMSFTLGLNLGLVMIKGVVFGLICCITVLPSLVLSFDKLIEKTSHRQLILGNMDKPSAFITKHYKVWLVLFLCLLFPAWYGNTHVPVYYDMSASLPKTLSSRIAAEKVIHDFDSSTLHIIMMDSSLPAKDKEAMEKEISNVDGVTWCIGLNSLIGPTLPDDLLPEDLISNLRNGKTEIAMISTVYHDGSDEVNAQLDEINAIVKKYDETAMVIGEAPLTKDLMDITDIDFRNVNSISILIVFLIIMFVFKSLTIPIILIAVIEFSIMVNMAVPFYQNVSLVFLASIILGTVQLGSTVDYAILMTTRYQKERRNGHEKKEAVEIAHKACMGSIITSGLSFFGATFGVYVYSEIEVLNSICLLLARGALISTVSVVFVLPSMFMIFDKVICHTTINFLGKREAAKEERKEVPLYE